MVRERIAVIPARGGSKRIPRKNLVDFFGKPLIAWTIDAAQESGIFDRILVSTDSEEIAAVGRAMGLEVPFLRDTAYDDRSPVSAATLAALRQVEKHFGERYRIVGQLMPNCPLRSANDIRAAFGAFEDSGARSQISCFRFGWMNPWWAVTIDGQSRPTPLFPEAQGKRSQDLPELFCPSGAIWIAHANALIEAGSFYCKDHIFYPMSWEAAIDIDDEEDLRMARALRLIISDT